MQLSARIDQVMGSLEALKLRDADAPAEANSQFASILENALESNYDTNPVAAALPTVVEADAEPRIPDWVDPKYGYDPTNPRKPNMRELMEALSGRSVEALYADANSNWQETSRLASELLYGVVGSNEDTRDWNSIMSSIDIVQKARAETAEMYGPTITTYTKLDDEGKATKIPVLQDRNGNVLRHLLGNSNAVRETIKNFGITIHMPKLYS